METPGELPGKSFTLYVTNVDGSDFMLRISGQSDKTAASLLERLMAEADSDLKAGKGVLPPGVTLPPGIIIAAQYKDTNFYRARVLEARDGMLSVLFVDYGNKDVIPASAARTLESASTLSALPAVATEYVLANVWQPAGSWDPHTIKQMQTSLCYRDHQFAVEAQTHTHTLITLQSNGPDISSHLVLNGFGAFIATDKQAELLRQLHIDSLSTQRAAVFASPPESGYTEHAVPYSSNRIFPTNPASTMRMLNVPSGSLNGGFVNNGTQIVSAVSQRLQAHRTVPRNMNNLKPLSRQPFATTAIQPAVAASRAPLNATPASVLDPSSPKKSLAYKVRFLQPNSEHKVYISLAREGPELFAVQLISEMRKLKEMMNELNCLPHRNLPSPPVPGTVCLGRQSSDRTICRALSMGVCGSNAKLFFVDFGDTELVSFYDVFVIPERFVLPPTYCFQFRLSRSHKLKPSLALNEEFQTRVEHQLVTLKVVQAEEAPLVQFAELYFNNMNITDLLLENSEQQLELKYLEALPVGSKQSVLVSYVDSCLKFFTQLSDNIDTLNEVMSAVAAHCKEAPALTSVEAGAACCALFPDDEVWYRARVVEPRGEKALVCYVDYGNEQEVPLTDLRSVTRHLLQLPAQALKCALKGFEDKPADIHTSNQLEMLALERTLRAHVLAHLDDGTMLVSLTNNACSPPLDIAFRMLQLSQPQQPKSAQAKRQPLATPPPEAAPSAAAVSSPEGSEPDKNKFRSDRYFRAERRPRDNEDYQPRGGSFRARNDRTMRERFERSGPGRHSEKYPRGGRTERPGGKPWERNQDSAYPSDDSSRPGNRSGPNRRKPKGKQPDDTFNKPPWAPKGDGTKRFRQGSDTSDASSHQSDGSQRTHHSSVQNRLKRDNFKKPEDTWGDSQDTRPKRENWGDKREGRRENSWDMRDNRFDKDSRSKDGWADKRDGGDRDSREDKKSDSWGDKKENFTKRNYEDRGERRERSNFTPRDRTDRSYDGDRSFGSNKSDGGGGRGGGGRAGYTKRPPPSKELPSPVSLDTQFSSHDIAAGSQEEVSVAWFISPESFYVQLTSQQAAFTDMMNSIPEIYKGVRPYTGTIDVGSSVLARFPQDRVLYRAMVLGVQPFGKYIVQYIDFGNKYVVESKDIWQLDQQLMNIPKMAVHCSVIGVKPPEGEWKTNKDVDLCFNAPRYQCVFQDCVEETYNVSLWNNGQSVGELLAEKKLAVLAEQTSATLKDKPIDLGIVVGQQLLCRVTHVASYNEFHVQLDLEKAELVEGTIARFDPALLEPLPSEAVEKETHCILTHEGKLHRAILQDATDKDSVIAFLPDYGYTVVTSAANLSTLPMDLSVYYYQSLVCSFNNYNEKSTKLMTEEELIARLKGNKFIIYINYVDGSTLVTTLYELSGGKVAVLVPDEGAYDSVSPLCDRAAYNYSFGGAFVSHAESLTKIYLQRASDTDRIALLLDALFKFYDEGMPEELESYDAETLCAAKSSDGNWYRAIIVGPNEEDCIVHFVDYGNDETLPKQSIKKLDPKFFEPYCLALIVSLGLIPIENKALDTLLELTAEQEVLVTLTLGDEGWLANLHLNGEDLSLKLVGDNLATPKVTSEEPHLEAALTVEPVSLPAGTVQVYISHIDTPGQFWLQMGDKIDRIEEIQAELQEKYASYPELENKDMGTLCVAKYSVDEMWYRAEILDSDVDITTVRFIDYGNTDVLDNVPGVLKEIPDDLKEERYAVKSSVNAVPTGTGQWSEPASDYFTELVGDISAPLDAVIVLKDVSTYVDLFVNGQNLTNKLVIEGYATKSEETGCGDLASCFASHVNSPSEFWIQLESSSSELEAVEAAMADSENFPELTDKEEGTLCAAKYPEDDCWYRAQVIVEGSEGIEVLFMDYGNASIASELRSLPEELQAKPALSRKCALQKPGGIKSWSRKSELKFNEMAAEGATIFNVQFIASGDISIVELFLDGKSVTEELAAMCESPPVSDRPVPLGQDIRSSGIVCHTNGVQDFYIQLDSTSDKLDEIMEKLTKAENFDNIVDIKVGSLVAAFWIEDEKWYRAKIIEFCDVGSHVQFIDYGNKAKCEKLKHLPTEMAEVEPLAKHCTLVGHQTGDTVNEGINEQFKETVADPGASLQIEFLDTTQEQSMVKLLLKDEDILNIIKGHYSDVEKNGNINNLNSESIVDAEEVMSGNKETSKNSSSSNEAVSVDDIKNIEQITSGSTQLDDSSKGNAIEENVNLEISTLDESFSSTEAKVEGDIDASTSSSAQLDESSKDNVIEENVNLETSTLDDSFASTEAKDENDLDATKLDDSTDADLTVIENISNSKSITLDDSHASASLDAHSIDNESIHNEEHNFSTPPNSPKKSESSSADSSVSYKECDQTTKTNKNKCENDATEQVPSEIEINSNIPKQQAETEVGQGDGGTKPQRETNEIKSQEKATSNPQPQIPVDPEVPVETQKKIFEAESQDIHDKAKFEDNKADEHTAKDNIKEVVSSESREVLPADVQDK